MTIWASLAVERITAANRGVTMQVIPCPACGLPNTKAATPITLQNGHRHWIRLRRYDTCHCVLTPVQDALVLRLARADEQHQEDCLSQTAEHNQSSAWLPSDNG